MDRKREKISQQTTQCPPCSHILLWQPPRDSTWGSTELYSKPKMYRQNLTCQRVITGSHTWGNTHWIWPEDIHLFRAIQDNTAALMNALKAFNSRSNGGNWWYEWNWRVNSDLYLLIMILWAADVHYTGEKFEKSRFFEAISPVRIRLGKSGRLMPSPDQDYHKQSGSDLGIWDMAFSSTFGGPRVPKH